MNPCIAWQIYANYIQISNISFTKSQKYLSSRLIIVFAQSTEVRFLVEKEDVVGAAPTGDAPTTFEWSTNSLPIKVWLILEV